MPTARDHYREAEDHLEIAAEADYGTGRERYNLAAAQVHATLALAATQGAHRPPLGDRLIEQKPAQGEEISDQMGGQPNPWCSEGDPWCPDSPCSIHRAKDVDDDPPVCHEAREEAPGLPCVRAAHDDTGPHVDAEGREFR